MDRGYIPLWRKFQENDLWLERRKFSRAECWIDILLSVRWSNEPETVMIKNKILTCGYGESLKSLDTWAKRWGHSKSNVRRVLILFQKLNMIEYESGTVTARIRVCNFSKYDIRRNGNETEAERIRNASGTHPELEVERQEGPKRQERKKKEKRVREEVAIPDWLDGESWQAYKDHREFLKKPMSSKAEVLAISTLDKLRMAGNDPVGVINQSIERSYTGLFELKNSKGKSNGSGHKEAASTNPGSSQRQTSNGQGKYAGLGEVIDLDGEDR